MCNRVFIHPLALRILTSIFGLVGIFEACPRVPDPDFVIGFAVFREAVSKRVLSLHQWRYVASIGVISPKVSKCAIPKLQPLSKTGEIMKMNNENE
ncbi:MAG: hypothetical protein OXH00_24720 [Candidatus Poribacteria bacterium]|nr:hypothetical protein [Candidatus Poribacteria bacterium]